MRKSKIITLPTAITTVGYGEITPRSFLGRLITVPILMFGLLLITLPSFVLGREFSLAWERMTRKLVSLLPLLHLRRLFHYVQNADQQRDEHEPETGPDSPIEPISGHTHHSWWYPGTSSVPKDLTNRKLAQNQTELSQQITELRVTVETQGRMIEKLLEALSKGKGVDRT
jgi:potassium voltage-gated channel Shal-related subfamily D protein 2